MFRLPTANHPARELLGDMHHVAEVLNPKNAAALLTILEARRLALITLAETPAASRVNYIILRADSDERWLVSFGRRGGWRKEWNFGTGRPQ
jgi:hypothetical protein